MLPANLSHKVVDSVWLDWDKGLVWGNGYATECLMYNTHAKVLLILRWWSWSIHVVRVSCNDEWSFSNSCQLREDSHIVWSIRCLLWRCLKIHQDSSIAFFIMKDEKHLIHTWRVLCEDEKCCSTEIQLSKMTRLSSYITNWKRAKKKD